jgi:hypothetical protein
MPCLVRGTGEKSGSGNHCQTKNVPVSVSKRKQDEHIQQYINVSSVLLFESYSRVTHYLIIVVEYPLSV